MPLDLPGLKDAFEELFADPPASRADCAQGWADAMEAYATGIVPTSTAAAAAASALSTALAGAFAMPDGIAAMETAFTAFAVALGGGMAGYAPTPPVVPVGFATQFANHPETHADAAAEIGDLINAWLTTGFSTLIALPNTVVTWS